MLTTDCPFKFRVVVAVWFPRLSPACRPQTQLPPLRSATWPFEQASPPSASLSTPSAKPAGLLSTPAHGVVDVKIALGVGVNSSRGERVVNDPVPPGATSISIQRFAPSKA